MHLPCSIARWLRELGLTPDEGSGLPSQRCGVDGIMGAQLWLALPDATRHGPSRFEHHAELPTAELGSGQARVRVIVGAFAGGRFPAQVDHPAVGLDVAFSGAVDVPLVPRFEHGVVPIDQPVKVEEAIVAPGPWRLSRLAMSSCASRSAAARPGCFCWAGRHLGSSSRCGGTS
jgi:hypothetical protein